MIMKFEDRLKQYRENKGWTQAELGEKSGVSSRMIQRYEAGTSRPRWDAAEKIAQALEVPVAELLGQSGMLVAEAADKGGAKSAREMSKLVEEVVVVVQAPLLGDDVAHLPGALHAEGLQHDADKGNQPNHGDDGQQDVDHDVAGGVGSLDADGALGLRRQGRHFVFLTHWKSSSFLMEGMTL